MNKLFFVFFLLLVPLAAAECDYPVSVEKEITEEVLYYDVLRLGTVDEIFIAENFRESAFGGISGCEFEVKNLEAVQIMVKVEFSVNTSEVISKDSFLAKIDAHKSKTIGRYEAECSIAPESVVFQAQEASGVTIEKEMKTITEQVCAKCSYGTECPAGVCYADQCRPSCPDGTSSCSNTCLPANVKSAGETYSCPFECVSGIGNGATCIECENTAQCGGKGVCNTELGICAEYYSGVFDCDFKGPDYIECTESQSCILPSSKKIREGYECIQECTSGYGKGGVCKLQPNIMFGLWFIIILLMGAIVLAAISALKLKKKKLEMTIKKVELKEARKGKEIILKEKSDAENKVKKIKNELHTKSEKLVQRKKEYDSLEEKYQKQKSSLKEKYEAAEKKLRLKHKKEIIKREKERSELEENYRQEKETHEERIKDIRKERMVAENKLQFAEKEVKTATGKLIKAEKQ